MNTKEFLEAFHKNEHINFRAIKTGEKPINLNGYFDKNMKDKLKQLNEQGYNIYFVVNGGGTKQEQINKINAVFADFDCGKDKNGKYYNLDIVAEYKQKVLKKVQEFKLVPSFIVETRNGIHVYWLVNDNATKEQFEQCQLQLIQHFHSDPRIKTVERIMRLPGYYWCKTGYSKYMCRIIKYNNVKYNIQDIINALPEQEIKQIKQPKKANKAIKPIIKKSSNNNIDLIANLDIEGMRKALNINVSDDERKGSSIDKGIYPYSIDDPKTPKIIVKNRAELYDTINKIDLIEFLGLENNYFNCIFHDDNTVSASIFINPETGHYIYKCHSSHCDFPAGTIIRIVERLAKCTKPKAINFIKDVYGIELIETEWQKEQKEILQANKDYLYSGQMEKEYPELYKRIKNYLPLLIVLNDIAMNNVYDEALGDDDKVIFFSSLRYIASIMDMATTRKLNDRINLFAFLGLLEKLQETEIPEKLLKRAKHEAAKKKQVRLPSFYSIPSYSDDVLTTAEQNAILFKEKNMTMKGWSRELLIRTFGEEVANKVYPQDKGKELTKASNNFTNKVAKITIKLINKKGYATEQEILNHFRGYKEINHTRLKRCLQEVLENYNLKRVRCNKQLKQKYRITSKGYPFLILKNQ